MFFQECADQVQNTNVIISPFSIATALTLLSQGANGKTFDEIVKRMYLGNDPIAIASDFVQYFSMLGDNVGGAILIIANQLFIKQGYQIRESFRNIANQFRSGVDTLNFDEPISAANAINTFIMNRTYNRIQNLISPHGFDSLTRFVLINAIYFKGTWENKFPKSQTNLNDFYVDDTNTIKVQFMKNEANYRYNQLISLNAAILEMKYQRSNIAFIVVLPNNRTGLATLEEELNKHDFSKIMNKMSKQKVRLLLPKFRVEFEIDISNVLMKVRQFSIFLMNFSNDYICRWA